MRGFAHRSEVSRSPRAVAAVDDGGVDIEVDDRVREIAVNRADRLLLVRRLGLIILGNEAQLEAFGGF